MHSKNHATSISSITPDICPSLSPSFQFRSLSPAVLNCDNTQSFPSRLSSLAVSSLPSSVRAYRYRKEREELPPPLLAARWRCEDGITSGWSDSRTGMVHMCGVFLFSFWLAVCISLFWPPPRCLSISYIGWYLWPLSSRLVYLPFLFLIQLFLFPFGWFICLNLSPCSRLMYLFPVPPISWIICPVCFRSASLSVFPSPSPLVTFSILPISYLSVICLHSAGLSDSSVHFRQVHLFHLSLLSPVGCFIFPCVPSRLVSLSPVSAVGWLIFLLRLQPAGVHVYCVPCWQLLPFSVSLSRLAYLPTMSQLGLFICLLCLQSAGGSIFCVPSWLVYLSPVSPVGWFIWVPYLQNPRSNRSLWKEPLGGPSSQYIPVSSCWYSKMCS